MKLRYQRRARADLDKIYEYIAMYDRAAAARLIDRIGNAVRRLRDYPRSAPSREHVAADMRILSIAGYNVLHRIAGGEVVIVRVMHSARDLSAIDLSED